MKPARFDYVRPSSVDEAVRALGEAEESRVMAGGQSLGPMLNLRVSQPSLVVDISRLGDLKDAAEEEDAVRLGAAVTHARIEDGEVPDGTRGLMRRAASGIAYRAVRNRGTIGGSLAHADPAGDWAPVMMALDAELTLRGPNGRRSVGAAEFIVDLLTTVLEPGEMLESIRIPKLSASGRWGHQKITRKAGDFADSLAVVVVDPERGYARAVLGNRASRPSVLPETSRTLAGLKGWDPEAVRAAADHDLSSVFGPSLSAPERSLHRASITRAAQEAFA